MTANTTPEAIELMQLAKAQVKSIDLLLRQRENSSETDLREWQAAAHSVLDCLLEANNTARAAQFQRNFLFIAKTYNADLGALLKTGFTGQQVRAGSFENLAALNTQVSEKIVLGIRQLRGEPGSAQQT